MSSRLRRSHFQLAIWVFAAIMVLSLLTWTAIWLPQRIEIAGRSGPSFVLAATDRKTIQSSDFAGHPYLVFFGYTHCPDICPTTLAELSPILVDLNKTGHSIKAIFVSVDPERDTLPVLRDFVANFGDDIIGVTGTPQQIAAFAGYYNAYYHRDPQPNGDYFIDHSALVYVIDGQGKFVGFLPLGDARAARDVLLRLEPPGS